MKEKIKQSMRIMHTGIDADIENNIEVCLADLARVGIEVKQDNLLVQKACELYCKWQFDFGGKGELFEKNYMDLRCAMALSFKRVNNDV